MTLVGVLCRIAGDIGDKKRGRKRENPLAAIFYNIDKESPFDKNVQFFITSTLISYNILVLLGFRKAVMLHARDKVA